MRTARRVAGPALFLLLALLLPGAPLLAQDALGWLPRTQQPDGSWPAEDSVYSEPAVTGLALLAFLGAGETHKHGRYKEEVKAALKYLKAHQDEQGSFARPERATWLRDHAIATLAMAEAYALTASPLFKASAQAGLDLLEHRREADLAWDDLETTTWAVLGFKSGKVAGLDAHLAHEAGVRAYLLTQQARGEPRPLAMEMTIRISLGDDPRTDPWLARAADSLSRLPHLPVWDEETEGGPDFLYWHFGTKAIFRMGGSAWRRWNTAMKDAIIDHQVRTTGSVDAGSWDPVGDFGVKAGRTVSTSLLTMCMETYYRYTRVFGSKGKGGAPAPAAPAGPGLPRWNGNPEGPPPSSREGYDEFDENPFRDPSADPLSTFGIDVDTASYANVRRILTEGRLPVKGAVRIEEMVNYFSYDYPQPEDETPFSVTTEVAQCPWLPAHRLLMIGLQGRSLSEEQVPPRNLVFLLDVSGSMQDYDKLPLVKAGLRLLVERLRPEDHVAMVVYAGASGVVLPPTSGNHRGRILAALDDLRAGGSTNAGEGIALAYRLAREHFAKDGINRVILATDGDFNVGVTSRSGLEKLIEKQREGGVFLTVLGVGTGNVQDSQMEMLADHGNGNYAYLDSVAEARKVLVEEAGGTLVTIAKDVKIQVEFNPNRVGSYRLIGYENRMLDAEDFADDKKDAGEIGAGHTVTALYEVTPPREQAARTTPGLRYQQPRAPTGKAFGNELATVKLRYKEPQGTESRLLTRPVVDPGSASFAAASDDFQFSAAVAAFGMLLRESEHRGDAEYGMVLQVAPRALGIDHHGHRKGFLDLVRAAARLAK